MLKNNKGIALSTVIVTVIIIFIILSTLVYSSTKVISTRKLNQLYNDIKLLNNEVSVYYSKNGKLPINESRSYQISTSSNVSDSEINFVLKDKSTFNGANDLKNPNDYDEENNIAKYYELKVDLLNNVTLDYAGTYIINEQSHTIYHLKGIIVGEDDYHSLPLNYKKIELVNTNLT